MSNATTHHPNGPSSLHKRKICSGSKKMEAMYPEKEQTEEATEGTLLHRYVPPGMNLDELDNDEQRRMVLRCRDVVYDHIHGQFSELWVETHYELYMELRGPDGKLNHGWADCVIVFEQHVVVLDWTFGYAQPDYKEIQVQNYTAMAMQKFDKEDGSPVLFAPRIYSKPFDVDFPGLEEVWSDTLKVDRDTKKPGLVLNPTDEGCRYCSARAHCPALQITALQTVDATVPAIKPDQAADYFRKYTLIQRVAKEGKAEIKRMALEGDLPGIEIKEKQGRRKIGSALAAARQLSATTPCMSAVDILEVSTVSYKDLENMYVAAVAVDGLTKKAAREQFEELIGDLVTRGAPSFEVKLTGEAE